MLNFLCAAAEEEIEAFLGIVFFAIVVLIVIGVIISKVKQNAYKEPPQQRDEEFLHPNARGQLTPEQSRYLQNNKRKAAQRTATTATTSTITFDGGDHTHSGSAETYDPIVGSLGAVSDEGCDELNGVRLIATDLMYETEDDGKVYDMNVIRKSLVLGEILNNPRFKKPYGKK